MTPFLSQITGIIRRGLSRTYLLPLSRLIGQKFLLSRVLVTVHETPAPGESTHALRLETHSGARTLTVEEVNDGHIPAE